MVYAYPNYYPQFKCTAENCRHSCCVGWEIDIDGDSLRRFAICKGALGDELRSKISTDGTPHFILDENERCPFLDEHNLCRLITERGEEFLCDICRDHPRYRYYLPERTEIGLGLCCEEAARLILLQSEPMRIIEEGERVPNEDTDSIVYERGELFNILQNRRYSLPQRIEMLLSCCGKAMPERTPAQWAEFYLSLERMDGAWTEKLCKLKNFSAFDIPDKTEYEQLLIYFLYRHYPECFDDFYGAAHILFAVLSTQILGTLAGENAESLLELARLYSAEIEYSDENLDLVYAELIT